MPALVAGIHALRRLSEQDVDGRDKPGHDSERNGAAERNGYWIAVQATMTRTRNPSYTTALVGQIP
jgi:hypothetical protein